MKADYYQQWKDKVIIYLGSQCVKCGALDCLQIDHIDPSTKLFDVSDRWSHSWDSIVEEIDKCQLLCETCHKQKHEAKHGSISMYRHHKCRCQACKEVWNNATRKWKSYSS